MTATPGGDGSEAPMSGNYMGATYTTEQDHEAQTSHLAARPGCLLLDYLRVRFADTRETWAALKGWLGPMTSRGTGWRGWYSDSAIVLDGGLVAWCRLRDRAETWGVLVDLPGRACAAMGEQLVPFLAWALSHGGRVTRCDFAIDDRDGRLTLDRILGAEASGALVTRWRSDMAVFQNRRRGLVTGWTVYLGTRKSDSLVRIYDKAGEQAHKGHEVPGAWVRFELECHQDFADAIARDYFSRGSVAVIEQINRRVRFTVPSATDSNKWRAPAAAWWGSFIGSVKAGPSLTCGEVPECTLERLEAMVERQAGPALATLLKADAGEIGRVVGIISRSKDRMRPRHHAALALAGVRI